MSRHGSQLGYTLVVVVLALAVLSVIGAGAIRVASSSARSSMAERSAVSAAACARAAREVMKSQIRFMQPLKEFEMVEVTDDDGETLQLIEPGHIPGLEGHIDSVQFITSEELGTGRSPALHPQISNDIVPAAQFQSSAARVTAICTTETGRTHEVEFLIRFGL